MTLWHELLANLAIVAIATSIWTFANHRLSRFTNRSKSLMLGCVMATGAVLAMLLPFQFKPGVLLDVRYTFLAIAGFIGGPLAAAIPLVASVTKRLMSGGTGISVAIPHILAATGSGLLGHWLTRGRVPGGKDVIFLSLAVVASGTVGFFVVLPVARWPGAVTDVVAPFGATLFVATLVAGMAIVQELKRQAAVTENRMYRAIIEALPDCLNAKDREGRFIAANPATAHLMGAGTAANLIGKTDFDFYPAETAAEFRRQEQGLSDGPVNIEQRFTRSDGQEAWLSTLKAPFHDADGVMIGLITHNREITAQKQLENELAQTQRRLTDAISSMADGLVMFDNRGCLLFSNERYLELFPLTADARTPGACLRQIIRLSIERGEEAASRTNCDETVEATFAAITTPGDRQIRLADGRWLQARTRSTDENGCLIVFSDITTSKSSEAQLRSLNERLEQMAHTDGLTGLLNRRAFDRALEQATSNHDAGGEGPSLLMIDVDRFKAYNDTYGHPAGDDCLRAVAKRISEALGSIPGSVVARYGGEEIAVILSSADAASAAALGRLLCMEVRSLALEHIASEKGVVTVSVGVATWNVEGVKQKRDLLRDADEALYAAKAAGRDCSRGIAFIAAPASLRA